MVSKEIAMLAARIRHELYIEVLPESFERTFAGKWQKEAGAYTWIMQLASGNGIVGGCEPIRKYITKKNSLEYRERSFNNFEIYAFSPDEIERKKEQTEENDIFEIEINYENNTMVKTKGNKK